MYLRISHLVSCDISEELCKEPFCVKEPFRIK